MIWLFGVSFQLLVKRWNCSKIAKSLDPSITVHARKVFYTNRNDDHAFCWKLLMFRLYIHVVWASDGSAARNDGSDRTTAAKQDDGGDAWQRHHAAKARTGILCLLQCSHSMHARIAPNLLLLRPPPTRVRSIAIIAYVFIYLFIYLKLSVHVQ